MSNNGQRPEKLTVAVLGTGRMASIHLAALAALRDCGLQVDRTERRDVRLEEIASIAQVPA